MSLPALAGPNPLLRACAVLALSGAVVAVAAACSSDKRAPNAGGDPGGGGTEGGSIIVDDGDSGTEGGANDGSANGSDGGSLGALPVVVAPVSPCVDHGGTTIDLIQPDAGAPIAGYFRLGKVGSRRFLGDTNAALLGFLDLPSGAITVTKAVSGNHFDFASEGASVGSAWTNTSGVFYTRYAADGSPASAVSVSSAKANAIAIASGGTSTLVVWGVYNFQLLGASLISQAGMMTSSVGFGAGTLHTRTSIAVAPTGTGYAVVWAGDASTSAPKRSSLNFAAISATGVAAAPKTILTAERELTVQRVVATGSGYLVLVNGTLDGTTAIVPLAADGSPSGTAYEFTGSVTGTDLAVSGSAVGLVAAVFFNDSGGARLGTPIFHALDATGTPKGGFICLGPAYAYATDVFDIAIDGDGNGNFSAALAKVPQHAKIVQVDQTGTKPPQ